MQSVAVGVGRVTTKSVAVGRWQTYVQEIVCQIFPKSKMRHPPCGNHSLGGRRLKGLEKIIMSGAHGYLGGTQPPS